MSNYHYENKLSSFYKLVEDFVSKLRSLLFSINILISANRVWLIIGLLTLVFIHKSTWISFIYFQTIWSMIIAAQQWRGKKSSGCVSKDALYDATTAADQREQKQAAAIALIT